MKFLSFSAYTSDCVVATTAPHPRRSKLPLGLTTRAEDWSVPQRRRMWGCQRLGGGTTMANHPRVVGDGDLEWSEHSHGENFGSLRKQLGSSAGGEKLGCSLYEVPPGRRAWPYHYHLANEEAIYVLEGSGTLRIGGEGIWVSEGDYVAMPVGEGGAPQIINSSETVLRCLCYSPMIEPDVMIYPDSGKVGIFGGDAPGGPKEERTFS